MSESFEASQNVNEGCGPSRCYALDWHEGCPREPGVYLFRIPQGHDLSGLELLLRLCEPDAYDWYIVTLRRDAQTGWLEYVLPRDGSTRIASSQFGDICVWWSKLPYA